MKIEELQQALRSVSLSKILLRLSVAGLFLLAAACETTQSISKEMPAQPSTVAVEGLPYELGELSAQTLALGDCGLFLFASKPEARFVFFAEAGKGVAKAVLNGKEIQLIRGDVSGEIIDLHFTEQNFKAPLDDIEIRVTINEAIQVEGGSQISSASLRLSTLDGWKMVIPVGGATSCRNS